MYVKVVGEVKCCGVFCGFAQCTTIVLGLSHMTKIIYKNLYIHTHTHTFDSLSFSLSVFLSFSVSLFLSHTHLFAYIQHIQTPSHLFTYTIPHTQLVLIVPM